MGLHAQHPAVYGLCIRFQDSCAESKELIQRVLELTRLEPLLLARKISSMRVLVLSSRSHFLLLLLLCIDSDGRWHMIETQIISHATCVIHWRVSCTVCLVLYFLRNLWNRLKICGGQLLLELSTKHGSFVWEHFMAQLVWMNRDELPNGVSRSELLVSFSIHIPLYSQQIMGNQLELQSELPMHMIDMDRLWWSYCEVTGMIVTDCWESSPAMAPAMA